MAEILDGSAKFERVQVARNDRLSMPTQMKSLISIPIDADFQYNYNNRLRFVYFIAPCDGYVAVTECEKGTASTNFSIWIGNGSGKYHSDFIDQRYDGGLLWAMQTVQFAKGDNVYVGARNLSMGQVDFMPAQSAV